METGQIVQDFIEAYRDGREVEEDDPRFQSIMELDRLAHDQPDVAWDAILKILENDHSTHVVEMLAAGPLEDLIEYHGPNFIDRIETRAREDVKFRHALGGVWESNTPAVQRYRSGFLFEPPA